MIDDKQPDLAFIDIGSNAVRLVFYCGQERLESFRHMCALGKDLASTGMLWPEGRATARAALQEFSEKIEKYPGMKIVAVATAALRDAADGPDFANEIEKETGIKIRILAGAEEARYAALGTLASGLGNNAVIGDLGGGSLDLTVTKSGKIVKQVSLPLGTRRPQEDRARDMIADVLAESRGCDFVANGGAWRALGQAYLHQRGAADDLHGLCLTTEDIREFCSWLLAQDEIVLERLLDGSGRGSDGLVEGARLMVATLEALQPPRVVFSAAGMREGLVAEARA